jgi:hypothetical protein
MVNVVRDNLMKSKILFLIAECFLLSAAVFCQSPVVTQKINVLLQNPPVPPRSAGASVVGNHGPQMYCYWVVATNSNGKASPYGPACINDGPITLSSANYNMVSWAAPPDATSYDLLRTSTRTAPTGACNCAVATGITALSQPDQSNSLNSYTVNTFVDGSLDDYLTNPNGQLQCLLPDGVTSCLSGGGSVGPGTPGTIPVFVTSSTIGNSFLTQTTSSTQNVLTFKHPSGGGDDCTMVNDSSGDPLSVNCQGGGFQVTDGSIIISGAVESILNMGDTAGGNLIVSTDGSSNASSFSSSSGFEFTGGLAKFDDGIATTASGGAGGFVNLTEGTAQSAASGHDILYADSTAHCIKYSANDGSFVCLPTSSGGGKTVTIGYAGFSLAASTAYYLGKVSGWNADTGFADNSLAAPITAAGNPTSISCSSLSGSPPSGGDASLATTLAVCDASTPSGSPTCGSGGSGTQSWTINARDTVTGSPTTLTGPSMNPGDAWALQITTPAWTSGPYTIYITCTVSFTN